MPRRNRVDPWGDLHAVDARGLFTGNRGCLVDDSGAVVRHHRGALWIICLTEYRGWRHPLARPGRWTPLFFLDEAVALAAGHRPCGLCRRDAYQSYTKSVSVGRSQLVSAIELNRMLGSERHRRGRGIERAVDRKLRKVDISALPSGTVIVDDQAQARLVHGNQLFSFAFDRWTHPVTRPARGPVDVLTPPISVSALANGYQPVLHPSVTAAPLTSPSAEGKARV